MKARVSSKGWVVIPAKLRHKYSIRPGDEVHFVDYGGGLSLILSLDEPARAGRGMLDPDVASEPATEAGAAEAVGSGAEGAADASADADADGDSTAANRTVRGARSRKRRSRRQRRTRRGKR